VRAQPAFARLDLNAAYGVGALAAYWIYRTHERVLVMKIHSRVLAAALLIAPVSVTDGAWACGFEDPNSATVQRGILNWTYPNALYVQGALTQAHLNRIIELPTAPAAQDLFGSRLRQTAEMLKRFGAELQLDGARDFAFSLVLIEPMLWTRYTVSGGAVGTSVHVKGPEVGDLVVVSAEAALKEMVARRLTFQRAEELGLVRFYGDPANTGRLRSILIAGESGTH
jgi:hypothetical protein